MNLKKVSDNMKSGVLNTSNDNDIINLIGKVNINGEALSISDFQYLKDNYPDQVLSYKIASEDENSLYSIKLNKLQTLNFYKL